MTTLILGGVRSGKSRLAERLAIASGLPVTYVATATAPLDADDEMRRRINAHRARRPLDWKVIEEPLQLAATLLERGSSRGCLLVECLTLWLTNLLTAQDEARFQRERDSLLAALPELEGKTILVSNETNMGIVPLGELSRRYCDEAGRLHQDLAQVCEQVVLTVAGLPQVLKGAPLA